MTAIDRRSFVAGASVAAVGTVAAAPAAKVLAELQKEAEIQECLSIYARLSPRDQAWALDYLRCLIAESKVEAVRA